MIKMMNVRKRGNRRINTAIWAGVALVVVGAGTVVGVAVSQLVNVVLLNDHAVASIYVLALGLLYLLGTYLTPRRR